MLIQVSPFVVKKATVRVAGLIGGVSENGKYSTPSRFQLNLLRPWPLSVKRSFDGLAGHLSENLHLDGFSDIMIDGQ